MSNNDGILITNKGVYGLVNPPPEPSSKDGALSHQDISSAAVTWGRFVDLSNQGFSFTPANPTFMAIIDKIPYADNNIGSGANQWYPLYQHSQIRFTQNQTFSKMRLWLKGRRGQLSGIGDSLKSQLPTATVLSGGGNWAGQLITNVNHPDFGSANRDGMCNNVHNAGKPAWDGTLLDSGICEGQTSANQAAGTYDVWDISGPTKLAAGATTSTYDMYTDISMNGWNLAWDVLITETAPNGETRYLEPGMIWSNPNQTTATGIKFYYNPQAFALVKGTNADRNCMGSNVNAWEYHTPPPVRLGGTNSVSTKYLDVAHADWKDSTQCPDFHVIHSQTSNFLGQHLWYCEKQLGNQQLSPPPPGGGVGNLAQWYDIPVIFKKDYSYLATISMQNITKSGGTTIPKTTGAIGPGLVNLDAMTYLELIV